MVSATIKQTIATTRLCNVCGVAQPLAVFRRRRKGGEIRQCVCNSCRNAARRVNTDNANRRASSKCLSAINREDSLTKIGALLTAMYQRFGGLAGFVDSYKRWYDAAPEGSVYRGRMLNMMLHLAAVTEPHQQAVSQAAVQADECDLSLLTNEELEQEMNDRIMAAIEGNPVIAIKSAIRLGWKIIPPSDEQH